MDTSELTWYTGNMPRGPKPKPPAEVTVNVGLKVLPAVKKEIEQIVKVSSETQEGRVTVAWIAHKLFMRGLEAYRKDKKLIGPAPTPRISRPVYPGTARKDPDGLKKKKGRQNSGDE